MFKNKKIIVILFFLISAKSFSQFDDSVMIKKITDEVLLHGKAYGNLKILCKLVGQRLSGSAGMYKGEAWGEKMLKESGADNVYLQQCMVTHWVRGAKEEARFVTDNELKPYDILSIGNAVGTGKNGVTAKVIEVKNFDELEKRKDEVKGKIVFYNYPFNKTYLKGAYGDAVRYRSAGASTAAKYGAVAVIVRSVTAAMDGNPHTGALRYNDSFPKIPAIAISTIGAEKLSNRIKKNYLADMFFIKTNCQMLADTIAHNIIGEIKGTDFPNEIITIGGHMDSWDLAEGANDDGAGMVQSIEVLRAVKSIGYKPKHTIRIVLFANEENGGKGGSKYAEEAKTKGEKYIMAMESDGGSEYPRGFGCGMTKNQFDKVASWKKYFEPYDADKFVFSDGGGEGADIGPLQTNFKTAQFGLNTTGQRYFNFHHSAIDIFENVNEQELHLGAAVMASMVFLVDKYGL